MDNELNKKIIEANIQLHHEEAKFYDQIHREIFNSSEQKLIGNILNLALEASKSSNIKVLDIGTGTGNISLKLLADQRANSIIGLDLSKEMLDELRKKANNNSKLELANIELDSFLAANQIKFDLITISSVLHHLPNYFASLDKIISSLGSNGVLAIFHEPTGEKSDLLRFIEWLDVSIFAHLFLSKEIYKLFKSLDYNLADYQISRGFSLAELKKYFTAKNDLEIIYEDRHNVFELWPFRLIGKLLPSKNNFIMVLKKK
jgi:ubiquinone/menaquinone biosynthesis C-methylase UbiE